MGIQNTEQIIVQQNQCKMQKNMENTYRSRQGIQWEICHKAMIRDIITLGRHEPLEKVYLKAAETTTFLSNNLHTRIEENPENISIFQKELLAADAEAAEFVTMVYTPA